MHAIPLREDETYYPDSDGEPVAETLVHLEEMVYVWEVLDERFEDDPNVFVGANMFLFYRKGDPRGVVAPDGFVVRGVPKLPGGVQRRKYMLWLEGGQVPCFVLETTSESTRAPSTCRGVLGSGKADGRRGTWRPPLYPRGRGVSSEKGAVLVFRVPHSLCRDEMRLDLKKVVRLEACFTSYKGHV